MTQGQAIELQKQIEAICRKHDLWAKVEYDNKPKLKMIRMEVFIKIDK